MTPPENFPLPRDAPAPLAHVWPGYPTVWLKLEAEARRVLERAEPAHDFLHVKRVVSTARLIAIAENANLAVVETAALLHELVNLPKNHPDSARSGEFCSKAAEALLMQEGAPVDFTVQVSSAIFTHAFSAGLPAPNLESQILQDADRLDAIGAIGIARCFASCASMQRPFYSDTDPFCREREPNDKEYGLDHFYKKLLRIPERINTATGKRLAASRIEFLHLYLAELERELAPQS